MADGAGYSRISNETRVGPFLGSGTGDNLHYGSVAMIIDTELKWRMSGDV